MLKGGKWGFIDSANKIIISFKYYDSNIERYSVNYMDLNYFIIDEGIAKVGRVNKQLVCIDKSDKKVACRQT